MRLICLLGFLLIFLGFNCKTTSDTQQYSDHQYTNELINESSPYLLQHAHNPVNWHPWNETTLAKAKAENKPLIISIGYAACHWCHVMEHESFEDTTVARIMNDYFIPIKVDREERPDVDDVYMTACQMVSEGGCGWPLNAIALPDGKPIWAGTYFPKDNWLKVLNYFAKSYTDENEKLQEYASNLTNGIQEQTQIIPTENPSEISTEELNILVENFLKNTDTKRGGKQGAPKFPLPNNWEFLLSYHHQTKDKNALDAVTTTLDEMAKGGIYDHLGGGFARYSTDEKWLVPHFEKMLYDNGQLVSLYAHAYQLTQSELYKNRIVETLKFIERELTDPTGGFYSSLDADSEGEEGKFYVWTQSEIDSLLTSEEAAIFNQHYQIEARGNWEHGKNILHIKTTETPTLPLLASAKNKLMQVRAKRVRPGLDDKVLTSWNALMLKGYADAFAALGDEKYRTAAIKNGNFIIKNMLQPDGRLNRNYKDGKSVINAFADDYALTADAFISLYQITFDKSWLDVASQLIDYALKHFYNENTGIFFYTSDLDAALIARKSELADNVISGSNSVFAHVLFDLGTLTYQDDYIEKSKRLLQNVQPQIVASRQPNFYANWLRLYLKLLQPPYEIAIVGDDAAEKRDDLLKSYLPHALLLGGKDEGNLELLKGKLQEGETMIYVCQNKVCKLPVQEVKRALELL
ncbi:MAG: thioredoxin domain-containing protein [Saprospiraceae bacterium]